jgi:YD repeat-containing protein
MTYTIPQLPNFKEETYFDINGNDSVIVRNGKRDAYFTYTYDNKKRLTNQKEYTNDNKLKTSKIYDYNFDGSYVVLSTTTIGDVNLYHAFNHDEKGNKIRSKLSDGSIYEFAYDANGNETKYSVTAAGKTTAYNTINTYNKQNQLIKSELVDVRITEYTYNKMGLVIETKTTQGNNITIRKYQYD